MFEKGDKWKGNRLGRPKAGRSLVEFIKVRTKNGRDLAQFYYDVFQDKQEPTETRLRAAEKLEFRAWGKPAQVVEGTIEQAGIVLHINVDPLSRPIE